MLELRPNCECCNLNLPADSYEACICSFECTFCRSCTETILEYRCPNCGGELVARPARPRDKLEKFPASAHRVLKPDGCFKSAAPTDLSTRPGDILFSDSRALPLENVLALYRALEWSSAQKPDMLHKALRASHSISTAWDGSGLVGLGNAISDGYLVVYYPHLLVHPEYQGRGIGTQLMKRLMARYTGFHQHMLVADGRAVDFYRKCGFERAGKTEPMWIYAGKDH